MSEREQHEIIGRTVLEHNESKKQLAALEARAREWANAMRNVAQSLCAAGVMYTGSASGFTPDTLEVALQKYPATKDEVVNLLNERRDLNDKIETLKASLKDMGVAV
jgi:hypothetical protein